jgi:hypothetical protein
MTIIFRSRRLWPAAAATAALLSAALAGPAFAGKPERHVLPVDSSSLEPPGLACPVDMAPAGILMQRDGGNGAVTIFDDGRILFTGRHPGRMTNVATGKSVHLDMQGSGALTPQSDGSVDLRLSGTNFFEFFPGDFGPGDTSTGRMYLFTGTVKLTFSPAGPVTSFESAGTAQDICAMLA